jgi:hypothetical protein
MRRLYNGIERLNGRCRLMQTAQTTKRQIIEGLDALSDADLEKVLAFMQALSIDPLHGKGIPGSELVAFFKQFPPFTAEERAAIMEIMDEIQREGTGGV